MPLRRSQPAAPAWLSAHVLRHAKAAGIDTARLLRESELHPSFADDEHGQFPLREQAIFLNMVAEALGDQLAGFHFALDFDFREWGRLYYSAASSDTLQDAIAREARASSLIDEGFRIDARGSESVGMAFHFVGIERRLDHHLVDFTLVGHLRMLRHLTGLHLVPSYVGLVHREHGDVGELERFLGTEAEFGAPEDQLLFDQSAVDVPLTTADPFLRELIAMPDRPGTTASLEEPFRIRVENAVMVRLGRDRVHKTDVAAELGMTPRALARRLASEGETFVEILDRARQTLAMQYLRNTRLPISQVAWLLGYAEAATFVRAVRRWSGVAPRDVRQGRDADF